MASSDVWLKAHRAAGSVQIFRSTDAFFFDIDGTLLVMRDLVHWNALHQAMMEIFDIDTNIDGLSYQGKTDIDILRVALRRQGILEPKFRKRLPLALGVVCREVSEHAQGLNPSVCPYVPELLRQICRENRMLAIASGNLEVVGWHKVSAAGLRSFFVSGAFGDNYDRRRDIFSHAVESARNALGSNAAVCFVGDTPDDILAARHVGASVIAVATGSFPFKDLANFNPDICCNTCAELLSDAPKQSGSLSCTS